MSPSHAVESWFSKRRLGLFMHFGLYAIEGWHEQDQMRRHIPRAEYERLISRFSPERFDPDAILDLAESVGMEYVCLTTKHHDGFCLWDTKQTPFNVMNSPYGKDLVGQLAEACHRRKMPLGLYYSVVDWHHPKYPNQGRHHEIAGPEPGDQPDLDQYIDFLREQVRELCSHYGAVRHWFWDMNVPQRQDPSINALIRTLQPDCVINDRGFDAGDFGTPEREYAEHETRRRRRFARPTEACNSVGTQSWGWRQDEDYYTSSHLMQSIGGMMSKGAHYLLNVGPDASGVITKPSVEILRDIGAWYNTVRESFDDTEPCSELTSNQELALTRRGRTLYVHLRTPAASDAVLVPPLSILPTHATLLNTGEALAYSTDLLPMYWRERQRILRIKGLARSALKSSEPLVIRLEFDQDLPDAARDVDAFKG